MKIILTVLCVSVT